MHIKKICLLSVVLVLLGTTAFYARGKTEAVKPAAAPAPVVQPAPVIKPVAPPYVYAEKNKPPVKPVTTTNRPRIIAPAQTKNPAPVINPTPVALIITPAPPPLPQVATNVDLPYPKNVRCDVYAWNEALNAGSDPRGQNGEEWDANSLNVNQVFGYYPENRNTTPPDGTSGYGFYDDPDEKGNEQTHMEYYDTGGYTDGNRIRYRTDGVQPPAAFIDDRINHWTFVPLPELKR